MMADSAVGESAPAAPAEPPDGRWISRLILACTLALLLARAASSLVWIGAAIPIRWDLSFPEGAVAARAADVARGGSPYRDWREWPHAFAPYGPLTYAPAGLAARAAGAGGELRAALIAGRLQSFSCILGIAALVFALARAAAGSVAAGLLGAAAALSWDSLTAYCASFRPDAPQVFFSLAALALALRPAPNARREAAAWTLLAVSIWFKAFSAATLILLFARAWKLRGRRAAALQGAAFIGAQVAIFLALDALTDGALRLNLFGSLENGIDATNWRRLAREIPPQGIVILLGGAAAAAACLIRRDATETEKWLSAAALLNLFFASAAALKAGSDINYLLESYALCAAAAAGAVSRRASRAAMQPASSLRPATLLAAPFAAAGAAAMLWAIRGLMFAPSDIAANVKRWPEPEIARVAARYPGPILTTIPYLALQPANAETVLDHFQYRALAARGRLSSEALEARIRARAFSAIMIEGGRAGFAEDYFAPGVEELVRANYAPAGAAGALLIFHPKPAP